MQTEKREEYLIVDSIVAVAAYNKEKEYIGHMAAIIESSEDAIISESFDGIIRSWNNGAEKMFGYTAQWAIGKHISLIMPAKYVNEEKDILERIRNNQTIDNYERVLSNKNGNEFYVALTISPIKEWGGVIIGVSKIVHDITARKNFEEQLIFSNKELAFQIQEKEKRVAELIIANKELVFQNKEKEKRAAELIIAKKELAFQNKEKEKRALELMTANKELIFQNEEKEKRAAELIIANKELAFQNEEKEKRASELIIANKELAFQNDEKEKRAAELIIANKELAFQNNEKEKRAAELVVANKELAFQNDEKEKRAAELIIANNALKEARDNIQKLNEELEQKVIERTAQLESVNKELESFSYSVSHDLRAPLRAIHGYAQILKEDFGIQFGAEANRMVNNITDNAKKMGQFIDDLLTFSRLGKKELTKRQILMEDMVKDICREIKIENSKRNIEFKIDELQPAQGDSMLIKQVWVNLISNAVKYSRQKEKAIIEIGCEQRAGEIIYYIKDNGAGFDMRYADKLFGVFQRLHTDEEFEGTGVGLAIIHRIIAKHGGKVWAEGKVNEGAVFHFSLSNKS